MQRDLYFERARFANRILAVRHGQNWSQERMASEMGLARSTVSKLERAVVLASHKTIFRLVDLEHRLAAPAGQQPK
jgi:transcriptional regulator with XRE-family HTH domain